MKSAALAGLWKCPSISKTSGTSHSFLAFIDQNSAVFVRGQYGHYTIIYTLYIICISKPQYVTPFFTFPPPALFFLHLGFFPWQRRLVGWGLLSRAACPEAFSNSKALMCLTQVLSPLRLAVHLNTELWLPRR